MVPYSSSRRNLVHTDRTSSSYSNRTHTQLTRSLIFFHPNEFRRLRNTQHRTFRWQQTLEIFVDEISARDDDERVPRYTFTTQRASSYLYNSSMTASSRHNVLTQTMAHRASTNSLFNSAKRRSSGHNVNRQRRREPSQTSLENVP